MNYKNRKMLTKRNKTYSKRAPIIDYMTIIVSIAFMCTIWALATHLIPKYPYLYREYIAQSVPLYNTFIPREEDVIRDNLSLSALNYLVGINLTKPATMLSKQIPVFSQFEHVPVVIPPVTPEPPPEEPVVPVEPVEPEPSEPTGDPTLEGINILIYHSHTTEAFVPTSGIPHTSEFQETIVKVGEKLAEALTNKGANVIHNITHHSKKHSESYRRSNETVKEALQLGVEFDLIIDLHRDGVGQSSEVGRKITTTDIEGVNMGRLLFVVGQRHDSWRNNLLMAQNLNRISEELYPSLSRGIVIKEIGNYNQDLNEKMTLIEIGGHWNTLEEAINTVNPLAEIINKALGE